jgi:hypothetical protein
LTGGESGDCEFTTAPVSPGDGGFSLTARESAKASYDAHRPPYGRLCVEVDVSLEEAQAILGCARCHGGRAKENAAYTLADLLSRRGLERPCERLGAPPYPTLDSRTPSTVSTFVERSANTAGMRKMPAWGNASLLT